jgi:hypothetical protein
LGMALRAAPSHMYEASCRSNLDELGLFRGEHTVELHRERALIDLMLVPGGGGSGYSVQRQVVGDRWSDSAIAGVCPVTAIR